MSAVGERGYKVLLLLGITAAAAVVAQCAIRWISKSSSGSKSIIDKNKAEKSKSSAIEKVNHTQSKLISEVPQYPNSISNNMEINGCTMLASKSRSAKMLGSVKDTKTSSATRDKKENQSWSELVEDEESEKLAKPTQTKENGDVEKSKLPLEENGRAHHDSGVVSPQNDMSSSQQLQSPTEQSHYKKEYMKNSNSEGELQADSIAGGGAFESSNNIRNDEEPSEVDGGLGSSVCGEDLVHGSNLADAVMTNQPEIDGDKQTSSSNGQRNESETNKQQIKSQRQATGGSDSGQGSEADDGIRMAYHFYIPNHLCGKLIGRKGDTVKQYKSETKCSIQLHERADTFQGRYRDNRRYRGRDRDQYSDVDPFELQVCIIEGTRNGIDRCLELIREKFPLQQHQDLTLEQINLPNTTSPSSGSLILGAGLGSNGNSEASLPNPEEHDTIMNNLNITTPTQLGLDQGAMSEVYVSAIVSGGHVFLQQPNHPTHLALSRLETCMYNVYTRLAVPDVPKEVLEPGLVCVANWSQQWYRVQVVNYDPTSDNCYVRFLDYGGYYTFVPSDLKQIRSDFLSLPFQALEVYLGNVIPPDQKDWPVQSAVVLEELVANQIISGRMLGVTKDYIPIVHLYGWVNVDNQDPSNPVSNTSQQNQQPRLLNRELVDRGVALWTEHIIASN